MKRLLQITATVFYLLISINSFSQGTAVNTSGAAADPSAIFDASSNNKGLLIPRMTTLERDAIINPASGLQIYNTTNKCFEYFEYGVWQTMFCATCPAPLAPQAAVHTPSDYQIIWNWNSVNGASGYKWNSINDYNTANDLGINTSYTQTGLKCATSYSFYVWSYNSCGNFSSTSLFSESTNGNMADSPSAGTHITSQYQIIWNWNTSNGATGYKYNTINDFNTATDNGTNTSYTQMGLDCDTTYSLYVWAYNYCGTESVVTFLSESTSSCPMICGVSNVSFNYLGSNVIYGTVLNSTTNECWLDRNLGASQVANAYNDANAFGDLFQWGRCDDGHQVRTSSASSGTSSTITPGAIYLYGSSNWYSGSSPNPDDLWQGANGLNNPCPTGWRVPTSVEFENEKNTWSPQNYTGAYANSRRWTMAGYRNDNSPSISNAGSDGRYWSSTTYNDSSFFLNFQGSASIQTHSRSNGFSVRCIYD